MKTYRITLTLRSPSASAWQADTIFGHLCWLLTWRYGEEAYKEWIAHYQHTDPHNDPPLLLSDGFPGELLPRPVPPPDKEHKLSKQEGLKVADVRKQLKSIEWLTLAEFDAIRQGQPFASSPEGERVRRQLQSPPVNVTFKNQISRLTGTTGDEGQLYPFVEQVFWKPQELSKTGSEISAFQNNITLYLRLTDQNVSIAGQPVEDLARTLFQDLQASGYGKRKSAGYGEIAACDWQPFEHGFAPVAGANAFVSLSHFVQARHDPTQGQWRVNVKYGKLGGEYALPKPFKHPLVMLTPGSWFETDRPDKAWYGRLVEDISPDRRGIVQYGYAFALPMKTL